MFVRSAAIVAAAALCGCAAGPAADFAAKNRPLEERCMRAQKQQPRGAQPGQTAAEIRADAKAAYARGELDKACDHL